LQDHDEPPADHHGISIAELKRRRDADFREPPGQAAADAILGRKAHEIFGAPDDVRFRSSMTLFARAAPNAAEFKAALAAYFGDEEDPQTLAELGLT